MIKLWLINIILLALFSTPASLKAAIYEGNVKYTANIISILAKPAGGVQMKLRHPAKLKKKRSHRFFQKVRALLLYTKNKSGRKPTLGILSIVMLLFSISLFFIIPELVAAFVAVLLSSVGITLGVLGLDRSSEVLSWIGIVLNSILLLWMLLAFSIYAMVMLVTP